MALRRRGVAKACIIRIGTRLNELESDSSHLNPLDAARQMLAKLKEHDADFKESLTLDLIEHEVILTPQQGTLYEHDNLVATLTVRILALADSISTISIGEPSAVSCYCVRVGVSTFMPNCQRLKLVWVPVAYPVGVLRVLEPPLRLQRNAIIISTIVADLAHKLVLTH